MSKVNKNYQYNCFTESEKDRIVKFFNQHKPPYVSTDILEEAQNYILEQSNQLSIINVDFDEMLESQTSSNQTQDSQMHINMLLKFVYFRNLCKNQFLSIKSENIIKSKNLEEINTYLYFSSAKRYKNLKFKFFNEYQEIYLPLKDSYIEKWNLRTNIQLICDKEDVDESVYTLKNIASACNTFNLCIETIFDDEECKTMFCREMIINIDNTLVLFLLNSPCLLIIFLNSFCQFLCRKHLNNFNLFLYTNKLKRKNKRNLPYFLFINKFFNEFAQILKNKNIQKLAYTELTDNTISSMYFFVGILRMFVSGKNDGDSTFKNDFLKHFNKILPSFVQFNNKISVFKFNSASTLSQSSTYSAKPLNNILYFSYYRTLLVILNIKKQLQYPNLEPGYKAALLQILLMLCTGCRYTEMFSSKFFIHSEELPISFIDSLNIDNNDLDIIDNT